MLKSSYKRDTEVKFDRYVNKARVKDINSLTDVNSFKWSEKLSSGIDTESCPIFFFHVLSYDKLKASELIWMLLFLENIRPLIQSLSDQQLANFCRILAVAISDLDIYENKSSCKFCM